MITFDYNTRDTLPIATQHCMHIMLHVFITLYCLSHYVLS